MYAGQKEGHPSLLLVQETPPESGVVALVEPLKGGDEWNPGAKRRLVSRSEIQGNPGWSRAEPGEDGIVSPLRLIIKNL